MLGRARRQSRGSTPRGPKVDGSALEGVGGGCVPFVPTRKENSMPSSDHGKRHVTVPRMQSSSVLFSSHFPLPRSSGDSSSTGNAFAGFARH